MELEWNLWSCIRFTKQLGFVEPRKFFKLQIQMAKFKNSNWTGSISNFRRFINRYSKKPSWNRYDWVANSLRIMITNNRETYQHLSTSISLDRNTGYSWWLSCSKRYFWMKFLAQMARKSRNIQNFACVTEVMRLALSTLCKFQLELTYLSYRI